MGDSSQQSKPAAFFFGQGFEQPALQEPNLMKPRLKKQLSLGAKQLESYDGQFGNVSAPTQVLNAVPETFFSALRNSACWIFALSAVLSIYISSPYDYLVLKQSSRPPVRLPSKNVS